MRRLLALVAIASLVVAASVVIAGINGMTYLPTPLVVGKTYDYAADCSDPLLFSEWDYRSTQDGVPGDWIPDPPEKTDYNFISLQEDRVGTFDVRCKATLYGEVNPPTFYEDAMALSVEVLPPSNDTIESGLNTDSNGYPVMELWVTFQPRTSGAAPIGGAIDGKVQERIGFWNAGLGQIVWNPWRGPGERFYLDYAGMIRDLKDLDVTYSQSWPTWPNGTIVQDYYQQNRAIIRDGKGNEHTYEFSVRHFRKVKTSATTWQLREV